MRLRPRRRRRMNLGASHRRAGRGGIRACCRTKWDGEWSLGDLMVKHRRPGLLALASRVRAMRCAGSLVADAQTKSWTYGPVIVGRVEDVVAGPHRRRHVQHHLRLRRRCAQPSPASLVSSSRQYSTSSSRCTTSSTTRASRPGSCLPSSRCEAGLTCCSTGRSPHWVPAFSGSARSVLTADDCTELS